MSLTPAMIDALLAAGGTAEQLAALIKADLAEREAKREGKRAGNAERQRRFKERQRDLVTQGNDDNALPASSNVTPSLSPSPLSSPQTPQQTPRPHTHPETLTPRARKGHRLPEAWEPAPVSGDLAASVTAWPSGAIERELAKFRDWAASATGQNALKSDWQAAWRNWLRRADDEGRYRNGRSSNPNAGSGIRGSRPDPALDMFLQAQRDLQAEAERENQGFDLPPRLALPPH